MTEYNEYENISGEEIEEIRYETNATKVEIEIKGIKIYAILDSGAGKNVISDKIRKRLQIINLKPSRKRFTIANGKKIASKGTVKTQIKFDGIHIPIEFEVIDSTEEDIILGTQWLDEKGNIDFIKGELTLYHEDKELVKPIIYKRLVQSDDSSDDIDEDEEMLNN